MQKSIQSESRGPRSFALIVAGALAVATVGGMALTHAAMPDAMMWDWHYGMGTDGHMAGWGVWGWGMLVIGLLWLALIIGVPLYLGYWLTTRSQAGNQSADNALAILREQYARGEIDDQEFERRRDRLTANR